MPHIVAAPGVLILENRDIVEFQEASPMIHKYGTPSPWLRKDAKPTTASKALFPGKLWKTIVEFHISPDTPEIMEFPDRVRRRS